MSAVTAFPSSARTSMTRAAYEAAWSLTLWPNVPFVATITSSPGVMNVAEQTSLAMLPEPGKMYTFPPSRRPNRGLSFSMHAA